MFESIYLQLVVTYFRHWSAEVDDVVGEVLHRGAVVVSLEHLADVFFVVPYFSRKLFCLQQIFLAKSGGYLFYLQRKFRNFITAHCSCLLYREDGSGGFIAESPAKKNGNPVPAPFCQQRDWFAGRYFN